MALPKDTSLFRDLAPRYMERLMADFPWTEEDAAAALGNAGVESLGFTKMQEVKPLGGGRGGLGGWQWTGPRRVNFEKWLGRKGLKANDFEGTYSFLFRELMEGGPEHAAVAAVRNANAYKEADGTLRSALYAKTKAFERSFERAGVPAIGLRYEWAQLALQAYRASRKPAPKPPVVVALKPLPPPPDIHPVSQPAPAKPGVFSWAKLKSWVAG